MSKSDTEGVDKEVGSQVQLVVYRIPKKNHDVMVHTCKYSNDMFRKYGCTALWDFPTWQYQALRGKGLDQHLPNYCGSPRRGDLGVICILQRSQTHERSHSKDGKGWRYGPTLQTIFGSNYAGNQFIPRGVQPPQRIGFVLVTLNCISSFNLFVPKKYEHISLYKQESLKYSW